MTFSETAAKWKSCVMDYLTNPFTSAPVVFWWMLYGITSVLYFLASSKGIIPDSCSGVVFSIWVFLGIWNILLLIGHFLKKLPKMTLNYTFDEKLEEQKT